MRARIDVNSGLWPAWWTLGISKGWPGNGEIDVMEYYRHKLLANIVCLDTGYKPKWHSTARNISTLGDFTWASQFHN